MSHVLTLWNELPFEEAAKQILSCCGSTAWARALAGRRPLTDEASLLAASSEIWGSASVDDWLEAFASHPRIGERKAPPAASAQSAAWSAQEQSTAASPGDDVSAALAVGNRQYERRFGRVFIICATGKSGPEILENLRRRLGNDPATELREAAEEQRKITNLRLKKWLSA